MAVTDVLAYAVHLAKDHNVSVIPIAPGSKSPPSHLRWKKYQSAQMSVEEVRRHFDGVDRLGIVMGKVSGSMECIDFDEPAKYEEWRSLLDENGLTDLTSSLVIELTPRGGTHVFYRCETIEGNQKLALRYPTEEEREANPRENARVMIETRGEGGLVVCQPTEGYTQVQNKLSQIPTISTDERESLIHAARSFNEVVKANVEPTSVSTLSDLQGRPGDDYNARVSWHDVLQPLGWSFVHRKGSRLYWKRPDKTGFAISATTGNGPSDLLYVHSTSCYPLDAEQSYSKFAVRAICNHGGDYSQAAKDLARQGYGDKLCIPTVATQLQSASIIDGEPAIQRRWNRVPYHELLVRPKKPMLIEGLLGERDNMMIFGKPKSGKTFVVIDFLLAAVCGGTFAGAFDVTRPLTVAYMTNEGLSSLGERIRACANDNQVPYDDISRNLFYYEDVPQLYSKDGKDSILNFAKEWMEFEDRQLDLLVIDTLNKATLGANENDNSDAAIVASNLFQARKMLGCASCLIHHTGKSGESVRGASGYDGDLDIQLKVTKSDELNLRSLSLTLAKDLGDFEDRQFTLASVDDTAVVRWLGSSELGDRENALARCALIMRFDAYRDWSVSELCREAKEFKENTIRQALLREVRKPNGIIEELCDQQGNGLCRFRYRKVK